MWHDWKKSVMQCGTSVRILHKGSRNPVEGSPTQTNLIHRVTVRIKWEEEQSHTKASWVKVKHLGLLPTMGGGEKWRATGMYNYTWVRILLPIQVCLKEIIYDAAASFLGTGCIRACMLWEITSALLISDNSKICTVSPPYALHQQ